MATRNIVPRANGEGSIGTAAKHWGAGHFDSLPNWQEYLAESTGYGIVSGCEPTISGLTVTVGAGIVHLADGTRKEITSTNITLDNADSTNPRIDLVYIDSTGAVTKITGAASASPVVPTLPSGGISVCNVTIAAGATTGTVNRVQTIAPNLANYGVVNVKDFGAKGDGVTDDTSALKLALDKGGTVVFPRGTYFVSEPLLVHSGTQIIGFNANIKKINNGLLSIDYPAITSDFGVNDVDLNEVDAVIILSNYKNTEKPNTAITELVTSVTINNIGISSTNYSTGIFGTVFSNCYFKECNGYRLKYLFKVLRCWLSGISESFINSAQNAGFDFGDLDQEFITSGGGGTSLRIEKCYVNGGTKGFVINNFTYSHLLSCACDGAINPYRINNCGSFSIRSCACEGGNAPAPIIKITNSFPVIVEGCYSFFYQRISESDNTKDTYYYIIVESSNVKFSYNRIVPAYIPGQLLSDDRTKVVNSLCQLEMNSFYGLTMERIKNVVFDANGNTISINGSFIYQCTGDLLHFTLTTPFKNNTLTDEEKASQVKIILPVINADAQTKATPVTRALFTINVYTALGTQGRVPTVAAYYGKVSGNILSLYTNQNLTDQNEMKPLTYDEMLSGRLIKWALVLEGTIVIKGLY